MPISRWDDDELRHAVERAVESGLDEVCHKLVNYCRRRMREGPDRQDLRQEPHRANEQGCAIATSRRLPLGICPLIRSRRVSCRPIRVRYGAPSRGRRLVAYGARLALTSGMDVTWSWAILRGIWHRVHTCV